MLKHYYSIRDYVVNSQNDITFYWKKSQLAAYYNRYSTDNLKYAERQGVIKEAVAFITSGKVFDLPEEYLTELSEPCKILGFYGGFPIFDCSIGMAKLLSRLGIYVDLEAIMISTPMDEHAQTVYALAKEIEDKLEIQGFYKKNRVVFAERQKVFDFLMKSCLGK